MKKVEITKIIAYNIENMINKLSYCGGSAETERAYSDFRFYMSSIMNRKSNIDFTNEDKMAIGEAVCKAINNNIKEVYKYFND